MNNLNSPNNAGLTTAEANLREKEGKINGNFNIPTKSVGEIFRTNILTFFNALNFFFSLCVFLTGKYENILFMGVVAANVCIGVFQELRAKRVVDRLSLIVRAKARVIRDGKPIDLETSRLVTDDVIILGEGEQVPADCEVISGDIEADESLVSGESVPVVKKAGDKLLAGSFVICGRANVVVRGVGEECFAFSIMKGAKYLKKPVSEMFRSINRIVKWLAFIIIPLTAALLVKSAFFSDDGFSDAVNKTVAAAVGMIPQGLILLTSIVMAVSVIRLARFKILARDMYASETLARVDVLCLDKTGTLTSGEMNLDELIPLIDKTKNKASEKISENIKKEAETALRALMNAVPDKNPTAVAVRKLYGETTEKTTEKWETIAAVPFSSARKWSGASFKGRGSYILGAAEFILGEITDELNETLKNPKSEGKRVLVLAKSPDYIENNQLPAELCAIAALVISNQIRTSAKKTLEFFDKQGVEIKIISGDDPLTVKSAALIAGVKNAERVIDMSNISMSGADETDMKTLEKIAEENVIFGRVTPAQKLALIKTLGKNHVTGMVGDGVNDVLSLKEADCSVAMQSGSEAARNVSSLVLLNDDFSALPKAVAEGRRAINNLERSAALFLTRTVYSLALSIIVLLAFPAYPFLPIQLTLINGVFIGFPSFILALEKNESLVRGKFMRNVLMKAVPYGFCTVFGIIGLIISAGFFGFDSEQVGTVATIVLGIASFAVLCRICRPINKKRLCVIAASGLLFSLVVNLFGELFTFTAFTTRMYVVSFFLCAAMIPASVLFPAWARMIVEKFKK